MVADLNGLSDPYVKVHCLGEVKRTHVVRKTLSPIWCDKIDFTVRLADVISRGLVLAVFDHDTFNRDDPLGEITVNLEPLMRSNQLHAKEDLPTQGPRLGRARVHVGLMVSAPKPAPR